MSKFFSNYSTPGTSTEPELDFSDHWVGYVKSTKQVIYSPKVDVDPNGHQYVDLGLPSGTLWATTYVNQYSTTGGGPIFAWGALSSPSASSELSWEYYRFGTENNLTKYNSTDGLVELELEDDAARANWGGTWRMPTKEQWDELRNNCTRTNPSQNGSYYRYTSNINGKTISFGKTGYESARYGRSNTGDFYFWLSTTYGSSAYLGSSSNSYGLARCYGACIRPVLNVPARRYLSQGGWSEPWNIPQ